MPANLDRIKEALGKGKDRIKELLSTGKKRYRSAMSNPNTRAFVIGVVCLLALVAVIIIISISISRRDSIEAVEAFVKKWAKALETGNQEMYKKLWDKEARQKNKEHFEKTVKLLDKELKIDQDEIEQPTYNPRENLYTVKKISVTLKDTGIKLSSHDLKIGKKGWLREWKILDDKVLEDETPLLAKTWEDGYDSPSGDTEEEQPQGLPSTKTEGRSDTSQPDSLDPIAGNAPLDTKLKISQVIGEWQVAWQERDIDEYMSKYADDAIITRVTVKGSKEYPITLTKKELRKRMERINKKYKTIKVNISNLRIDGNRASADVKFIQGFIGTPKGNLPIYSDVGTKTLTFMIDPSDGYWKIYEEDWREYKGVKIFPKL